MQCQRCGALWLLGYYEDFDAVPVMAEWGVRTWIWRPLTSDHVARIKAAEGTGSLDLEEFAIRFVTNAHAEYDLQDGFVVDLQIEHSSESWSPPASALTLPPVSNPPLPELNPALEPVPPAAAPTAFHETGDPRCAAG